jgi:glutamate dehydrogenase
VIYLETERPDARQRRELAASLTIVLGDVHAAVADWPKLQAAALADAERIEESAPEGAALLRWLNEGMLTQLGHLTRRRDGAQSGLLGICRKSARALLAPASYERAFKWFEKRGRTRQAPLIVKANRISNVHRRVPLDLFIVPIIENGAVAALSVHAGVWTSAALAAPPDRVPRLREELTSLMTRFGFDRVGPCRQGARPRVDGAASRPLDRLRG